MKDYAKIDTTEKFDWAEVIISVLILPSALMAVLLIQLTIGAQ